MIQKSLLLLPLLFISTSTFAYLPERDEALEILEIINPVDSYCKYDDRGCVYQSLEPLLEKMDSGLTIAYDENGKGHDSVVENSYSLVIRQIFESGRFSLKRENIEERYSEDAIKLFKRVFENKLLDPNATSEYTQFSYLDFAVSDCATPIVDILLENGGKESLNSHWIDAVFASEGYALDSEQSRRCHELSDKLYSLAVDQSKLENVSLMSFKALFYRPSIEPEPMPVFRRDVRFAGTPVGAAPELFKKRVEKLIGVKFSARPSTPAPDFNSWILIPLVNGEQLLDQIVTQGSLFKKKTDTRGNFRWNDLSDSDRRWVCYASSVDEYIGALLNSGMKAEQIINQDILRDFDAHGVPVGIVGQWTFDVLFPFCNKIRNP